MPDATTTTKGVTRFAGDGSATEGRAVQATDGRLSNARTPTAHQHPISDVTGLQTALDGKAPASHSHAIADVTGLSTALSGKSDTSHTHAAATGSASGFMSAADKTKLNSLGGTTIRTATGAVPALLAGVSSDVTFTFASAFPLTAYSFNYCVLGGISLGSISVVEKTRTTSSITLTIKNTALLTLSLGSSIIVTAFTES